MKNFKEVGTWWNSRDIKLVEIEGKIYALNGWNGERYYDCWEVASNKIDVVDSGKFEITPIDELVGDPENEEYETVAYEVR